MVDLAQEEKMIIGTLVALVRSDIPEIQNEAPGLIIALSIIISPSYFTNSFFGDVFDVMLGDIQIGLAPDYDAVIGQLEMDGDLPEDAEEQIKEALTCMNSDYKEVLLAAIRMRETREIKRAVENATWKTNAEEE